MLGQPGLGPYPLCSSVTWSKSLTSLVLGFLVCEVGRVTNTLQVLRWFEIENKTSDWHSAGVWPMHAFIAVVWCLWDSWGTFLVCPEDSDAALPTEGAS